MATYLPSSAINGGYHYTISNDHYTIRTNQNCYTNYNTTYCNCYDIYPKFDYISTEIYSCAYNNINYIDSSNFTSDIWYN